MKKAIILTTVFLVGSLISANAEQVVPGVDVCPMCSMDGLVTCPNGFEITCEAEENSQPQCIFLGSMYVPGCYKYQRDENIDLSFLQKQMPPSTMTKIIGKSQVFTLNREAIGCKKAN